MPDAPALRALERVPELTGGAVMADAATDRAGLVLVPVGSKEHRFCLLPSAIPTRRGEEGKKSVITRGNISGESNGGYPDPLVLPLNPRSYPLAWSPSKSL